ncbi:MAG: hypothetical protein MI923_20745, partial [Phycisphaerales bacterium]|nr:hypothetical protein [Phycisphaerales bacterium]
MIRLKLGVLSIVVCLTVAFEAQAIDITVTNLNPSGGGSLADAIAQANMTAAQDNILFQAGLNGTITPNATLLITQPILIDGDTDGNPATHEITVSGNSTRTVFRVNNVNAEFKGFRVIDGVANQAVAFNAGGGILMLGSATKPFLILRNMAFENNQGPFAGAVSAQTADVGVFDTLFRNNRATGPGNIGGALDIFDDANDSATHDVVRCTFINNETTTAPVSSAGGGGGGAISSFTDGDTTKVEACYFMNNQTRGGDGGGAIYAGAFPIGSGGARSATLNVTDSFFVGNQIIATMATVVEGGAILVDGGDPNNTMTTTITGSTFLNNSAVTSGGAVMLSGAGSTSGGNFFNTATIQNSTFEGNSGEFGGAIYSNNTRLAVDSCTITNNTATGIENDSTNTPKPTAGGISLVSSNMLGTFTIRNTILDGNSGQQMRAYNGFQNGSNTSLGNNLINGTILDVAGFSTVASDRTGASNLAALAANGKTVGSPGNTAVMQTRAPNAGSQVLNNGNTDLTTDQNGNSRPDGPQDDIGAIEGVATTPPTANCQSITAQLDASGNVTVNATQIDNNSTPGGVTTITAVEIAKGDQTANCAGASFSPSVSYNCSDVGARTVTLRITQSDGEAACCTATVTVEDNVAPTAACQDTTVQLDANGNASITGADVDNGSNDACGIASLNVSPNSFTCANVGNNTVTLTVTDNNGNTSTCTATVMVEDNVAPTAACQDMTVQLDATGNASITTNDVENGSSDACGLASLNVSPNSFTCANVGGNMVTLTATDNNG